MNALRKNGKIYFLDRPLDMLMPTEDRPTASNRDAIERRYNERISIYRASADKIIDASGSPADIADEIISDFLSR